MKAYKGFNRDMTCRGFQFEEGKEYHEEKAELCESGFHACENPLDTFNYYYPGNSVFHEVELDEVSDERNDDDTKICAKTIRVGTRLDVAGLCKAHFEYVSAHCKPANGRVAGDKESAAAGEQGSAAAGYKGSAAAGNWGSAAAGEQGSAAAGEQGSAAAGEQGLACCRGGKVKGGMGAVIVASELDDYGKTVRVAAAIVDGEKIKADTWYTVKNGEFVEVDEK
ncbi:hypothetical protein [Candidatus Allofournierella merdipullorum]|uniref:DUF7666 domain-containing protein n=1 Tax=Candidatus Allofournierella merdipullorum TaxID=2838595 RepID=UPI002A8814A5|nr:hypothetical protein [Candidatus Fournierella merdipullorum]